MLLQGPKLRKIYTVSGKAAGESDLREGYSGQIWSCLGRGFWPTVLMAKGLACGVPHAKRYCAAYGDVPRPRHRGELPQVNVCPESKEHAQHGAILIGAAGEDTEQEDSEQRAISDRGNLQSDFDHASYTMQAQHG